MLNARADNININDTYIVDHFKFQKNESTHSYTATMWKKSLIRYNLIGDKSYLVRDVVADLFKRVSNTSGLIIDISDKADILMIYDSGVFSDLKNNARKFLDAGIPSQVVTILINQAEAGHWQNRCQSFSWTNDRNEIIGGIILSQKVEADCVSALIPDLFGLKQSQDDNNRFYDFCIIYTYLVNKRVDLINDDFSLINNNDRYK